MASAALALKKVIEKHLQELGFLWGQRTTALRSPDYRLPDVNVLDGRIEAHLDGLRIAGKAASEQLATHLQDDSHETVFAAALALLQSDRPEGTGEVIRALLKAPPGKIEPFRQALVQGQIERVEEQLVQAAESAPPHVAVAALEALTCHGCKNLKSERLVEFVRHVDPAVRCAAWRIVAMGEPARHP